MLTESLTYLKDSDDVWKTSIIGGVLLLFSFLLIPLFVVLGYVVQVLDRTSHGDDEAPVFENWGDLAIDGAKAFVIVFVYSLVPAIVGAMAVGGVLLLTGGGAEAVVAAGVLLASLLTFGLFVAVAYVVPAALAQYAEERRIAAGFEFETLRPVLRSGTYAARWLLALGIVLVGSFVSGIFAAVPFVGAVLGAIVGFYALVAAYYVVGHAWRDLHEVAVDERDDDHSSERPAI